MLALSFRAGSAHFALRAAHIVRVLPMQELRPLPAAPFGVVGMLEFEADLVPVVDLALLLEQRPADRGQACRLLLARVDETPVRLLALLVTEAWDMVEVRATLPRMRIADAAFLGDFVRDAGDAQLIELSALLPDTLRGLARERLAPA